MNRHRKEFKNIFLGPKMSHLPNFGHHINFLYKSETVILTHYLILVIRFNFKKSNKLRNTKVQKCCFGLSQECYKPYRKTPLPESLSLYSCRLPACNFIKKRLLHWCFPVNFVKFLKVPISKKTQATAPICSIYFAPISTISSI